MGDARALLGAVSKTQGKFAIKHIFKSFSFGKRAGQTESRLHARLYAICNLPEDCSRIKSPLGRRDSGIDERHPGKHMRRAG